MVGFIEKIIQTMCLFFQHDTGAFQVNLLSAGPSENCHCYAMVVVYGIYIYIYVHVFIFIFIYIYTHIYIHILTILYNLYMDIDSALNGCMRRYDFKNG